MQKLLLPRSNINSSTDQDSDQVTDQDQSPITRLLTILNDDTLSAVELMK